MQFSLLFTTALAVFSGSATAAPTEEPPSDVCLMICYFQQPNCTEPAYAKKSGDCWTCCNPVV